MIEIYGGPHDGRTYNRRPKRGVAIFVSESGVYHPVPKPGDEALIEIGRCPSCGARVGKQANRRFAPLSMPVDPCQLCGATREETHDRD